MNYRNINQHLLFQVEWQRVDDPIPYRELWPSFFLDPWIQVHWCPEKPNKICPLSDHKKNSMLFIRITLGEFKSFRHGFSKSFEISSFSNNRIIFMSIHQLTYIMAHNSSLRFEPFASTPPFLGLWPPSKQVNFVPTKLDLHEKKENRFTP